MIKEYLEEALAKKFKEPEYQDCFLIEVVEASKRKIQVFVDKDSGVDFKTCKQISRYLESLLDEETKIPQNYILEVSSPGAERPLKLPRQYKKHLGRKFEVVKKDGGKLVGKLTGTNEKGIELEIKNGKQLERSELHYDQIEKAKVVISFK